MSEKFPELQVRKISAPEAKNKKELFLQNGFLQELYFKEQNECICTGVFLNAFCNYPLLIGQKANLYKCVLTNCMDLVSDKNGYIGLLTPESIYDDPKGQPLRKELYKRLRYHFQYQNELRLFAEVHHHTVYGDQLLGPRRSSSPRFASLSNLFHPNTVDACFAHDGHGLCGGIKDKNGNWNTAAHKDRIVYFGQKELKVLSDTFEDGTTFDCAKLVNIHANEIINILSKFAEATTKVSDSQYLLTQSLNEVNAINDGLMQRVSDFTPNISDYELIYSGPHFFICNPLYKTSRKKCILNSDYDNIDLQSINDKYIARSNYKPIIPKDKYINSFIQGFKIHQDTNNQPIYMNWIDCYKVGFRNMLSQAGERTLICAILPRKTAHIHGVISVAFRNGDYTVDMVALCSSIILDFYIKTIGASNLLGRILKFPLGVPQKFKSALYSRTLLLNCLNIYYSELWQKIWQDSFTSETWSIEDNRLKPFTNLTKEWNWNIPLRNYFERRQALVEIDVISAMVLGLTLKDLEMIYTIQFPVLQQNENDTWYDTRGNIVFTCSKGLTGVGVDRPVWNTIKDMKAGETYLHTIEKSELYRGQQVTYYAPFTKCDRIEDYRHAWTHFEKQFKG